MRINGPVAVVATVPDDVIVGSVDEVPFEPEGRVVDENVDAVGTTFDLGPDSSQLPAIGKIGDEAGCVRIRQYTPHDGRGRSQLSDRKEAAMHFRQTCARRRPSETERDFRVRR